MGIALSAQAEPYQKESNMLLIENSTNNVIISAYEISLYDNYAQVGRTKYYGGIGSATHSLIDNVSIPYGQATWWNYNTTFELTAYGLEQMKLQKQDQIRNAFAENENNPVDSSGQTWNGGYESALKLDAAKRVAELTGNTSVTFFDIDNIGHVFNLADAETVVIDVGMVYETLFHQKQALFADIEAATNRAELEAIQW